MPEGKCNVPESFTTQLIQARESDWRLVLDVLQRQAHEEKLDTANDGGADKKLKARPSGASLVWKGKAEFLEDEVSSVLADLLEHTRKDEAEKERRRTEAQYQQVMSVLRVAHAAMSNIALL